MTLLLEVTIPMLPPSVNRVYMPVHVRPQRGHGGFNTIRMTKEATDWIGQATLFLPPLKLPADQTFRMELSYHSNWFLKDGVTLKNKDVRNYEKLVTDTIFRRYALNDKLVWESLVTKMQDTEKEKVVVKLFTL